LFSLLELAFFETPLTFASGFSLIDPIPIPLHHTGRFFTDLPGWLGAHLDATDLKCATKRSVFAAVLSTVKGIIKGIKPVKGVKPRV
jgi:hypothetical protein